jgi:hypothetical protein
VERPESPARGVQAGYGKPAENPPRAANRTLPVRQSVDLAGFAHRYRGAGIVLGPRGVRVSRFGTVPDQVSGHAKKGGTAGVSFGRSRPFGDESVFCILRTTDR